MAIIMKGKEIAEKIKADIVEDINELSGKGIKPTLAAIRVGERPDAISYEKSTVNWLSKLEIGCEAFHYPENISQTEFLAEIEKINRMKSIHGMLIFRPLPEALDACGLEYAISSYKDMDGMNPLNFGMLCAQDSLAYAPCTAEAVMEMLKYHNIELSGKNVVVLGRSMVIGKPVSIMLTNASATVTVCHSKTKNLAEVCAGADILVAAIGKPGYVTANFIKEGAVVVDVGINVLESGKVTGDVAYDEVAEKCSFISPVPGGVGSVTNAVLARHIVTAAKRQCV